MVSSYVKAILAISLFLKVMLKDFITLEPTSYLFYKLQKLSVLQNIESGSE